MPSRIAEVDAAPPMIGVDLVWQTHLGISPVFDTAVADALIDGVKTGIIHEEGVMLHLDVVDARFCELEENAVINRYGDEWPHIVGSGSPKRSAKNVADMCRS